MRNPWMSMYLSAANKMAGAARGQMMAEASRQQAAISKAALDQMTSFWTGGFISPEPKRKTKARS